MGLQKITRDFKDYTKDNWRFREISRDYKDYKTLQEITEDFKDYKRFHNILKETNPRLPEWQISDAAI